MTEAGTTAPRAGIVSLRALMFGIFGAPAAWVVQMIADYSLVSHYCFPGNAPVRTPSFGGVRGTTVLVSAVLILVALLALLTAYRSWKATRQGHENEHHDLLEVGEGRARFMALSGILTSVVFLFALVMSAVPLATNPVCMS